MVNSPDMDGSSTTDTKTDTQLLYTSGLSWYATQKDGVIRL
jgi:hypothetical protein